MTARATWSPAWNRKDLLGNARSLREQEFRLHIIVVDDGSTDGTAEFTARRFRGWSS